MAHLNFFGIDNFRVFQELNRFEFRPITVLVGKNSSGKSSLTKGILCLKSAFEEIKYKPGKDSKAGEISMYETEFLYFKPYLNLGNFETCVNNNSDHSTISFELPMRFPLVEDTFSIKFIYEKENSILKRGIQKRVCITHIATDRVIFSHDNNTGETRINFSYLKSKLDESFLKIEFIENLNIEIKNKIEPFQTKDEQVSNKIPENLPENIALEIKEIAKIKGEIFPYYKYYQYLKSNLDVIDENSFSNKFIYSNNIDNTPKKYDRSKPFFNYSVLFDENALSLYKDSLSVRKSKITGLIPIRELFHEDELLNKKKIEPEYDILKETKELKNKFSEKIGDKNLPEYLSKIELDTLDNLIFQSITYDPLPNWLKFFSNSMNTFNHFLYTNFEFHEKLFEQDELFREIFDKFLFVSSEYSELPNNFDFFIHDFIYKGIGTSLNIIGDIYKSMHYIPSVRTKVDRIFRVGSNNSYLQEVLFSFYITNVTKEAREFINSYLKIFGIADEIDLVVSEDSDSTKIYLIKDGVKKELADLGYGISQVLPIILKLAVIISNSSPDYIIHFYYSSSIVIIEEPETNLHPALQSKLADMFVECYQKYNIQFIIETHSEYLIRKLQFLTAKKTIQPKDSIIYYFHEPNHVPVGEKQVKKIEILEDGSLSDDFGSGFFDEAANWELELLRLKNLKNRQN